MLLKERAKKIFELLRKAIPNPETELNYRNPYELLVAVILSAQCTDKRVNQYTPEFFNTFPDPQTLAEATPEAVYEKIKSISFPNNKTKHLKGMARLLVEQYGGKVPDSVQELIKLPGVGRKTANVIASVIYDQPALAVDTHVFRVSNRLGLTKSSNPLQTEKQLLKLIPRDEVADAHHLLILHGRYTCVARNPKCEQCPLPEYCNWYKRNRIPAQKFVAPGKAGNKKVRR